MEICQNNEGARNFIFPHHSAPHDRSISFGALQYKGYVQRWRFAKIMGEEYRHGKLLHYFCKYNRLCLYNRQREITIQGRGGKTLLTKAETRDTMSKTSQPLAPPRHQRENAKMRQKVQKVQKHGENGEKVENHRTIVSIYINIYNLLLTQTTSHRAL